MESVSALSTLTIMSGRHTFCDTIVSGQGSGGLCRMLACRDVEHGRNDVLEDVLAEKFTAAWEVAVLLGHP